MWFDESVLGAREISSKETRHLRGASIIGADRPLLEEVSEGPRRRSLDARGRQIKESDC